MSMTIQQQIVAVLRSRKFWVLLAGLVALAAAYSQGQIDAWQALQGALAAGAVYSLGVAHEDAGGTVINLTAKSDQPE